MSDHQTNAILIGGVGGSGTRIFAEALLTAGMRTLTDLNRACDAQGCTLLFKRPDVLKDIKAGASFSQLASILDAAINGEHPLDRADRLRLRALTHEPRLHHSPWWLWKRSRALRRDAARQRQSGAWFIKEPNLHIVAGELLALRPETKFVMAVRHGVDMAFSSNQQQVAVWGPMLLEDPSLQVGPVASLRYWCHVHRRIEALRQANPSRVEVLSFDQLCRDPETVIRRLLRFCGVASTDKDIERVAQSVKPPPSIGRRHNEDLSVFDSEDISFVDNWMSTIEASDERK